MYDVKNYIPLCNILKMYDKEKVLLIGLDDNLSVVKSEIVATGNKYEVEADINKVSLKLKNWGCKKYILCHNHVVGPVINSDEDDAFTKEFLKWDKEEGYKLIDHVIIGKNSNKFFSYEAVGLNFTEYKRPVLIIKKK